MGKRRGWGRRKNLCHGSKAYPWSHFDLVSYGRSLCRRRSRQGQPSRPRLLTGAAPVLQHSIGRIPVSSLKRQQGAQARFVSLRLFVRCHGQRRGVEQVTQSRPAGLRLFRMTSLKSRNFRERKLRYLLRGRTVGRPQKKSVYF